MKKWDWNEKKWIEEDSNSGKEILEKLKRNGVISSYYNWDNGDISIENNGGLNKTYKSLEDLKKDYEEALKETGNEALLKDENSEKKIEESEANGFTKEQSETTPNDVLTKNDNNADIKIDDDSKKNLEEVKDGNLDAKIEPDSKFKLSPEMLEYIIDIIKKALVENGKSKKEEKKEEKPKDENHWKEAQFKAIEANAPTEAKKEEYAKEQKEDKEKK